MKEKKGLSGSTLKIIAVIAMMIDHTAAVIIEDGYLASLLGNGDDEAVIAAHSSLVWFDLGLRLVGRMAFPLFAFLVVEGYRHTKDIRFYLLRMGIFALISEVPYDMAARGAYFSLDTQNTLITLTFGLAAITVWNYIIKPSSEDPVAEFFKADAAKKVKAITSLILFFVLGNFLRVDYFGYGVAVVFIMYLYRQTAILRNACSGILLIMSDEMNIGGMLAFIPMHFYNGERGLKLKYFFYILYPVHLLILFGIQYWLFYK